MDAVVRAPWLSRPMSTTWHVREYPEAYRAMPDHLFEAFLYAYLGETNSRLGEEAFEAYLAPWQGEEGRRAFVRQALQSEEQHTGELVPLLGSIEVPVRIVWGEEDGWLDPSQAPRLREEIPNSSCIGAASPIERWRGAPSLSTWKGSTTDAGCIRLWATRAL